MRSNELRYNAVLASCKDLERKQIKELLDELMWFKILYYEEYLSLCSKFLN